MSIAAVQKTFVPNAQQPSQENAVWFPFVHDALGQLGSVWRYAGKIISMTKNGLHVFVRAHPNGPAYEKIVNTALAQLKIPSFCSGVLNIAPMQSDLAKTVKYAQEGDYSSAAFSGISTSLLAVDTFDSFSTFIEGYRHIREFPPIRWVGKYGKSIGFYLSIIGSVAKLFKICHSTAYSNALFTKPLFNKAEQLEQLSKRPGQFKQEIQDFLNETIGLTKEEHQEAWRGLSSVKARAYISQLLARKERNCIRNTSKKVFEQLKALNELMKKGRLNSLADRKKALSVIQNVRTSILGNVINNLIGIAANILTIVGLVLLAFTAVVAPWVPFAVFFLGFAVRLANVLYEDYYNRSYIQEMDLPILKQTESS